MITHIMMIMMLSTVSFFSFSQEAPATEEQTVVEEVVTEDVSSPQETPVAEQEETPQEEAQPTESSVAPPSPEASEGSSEAMEDKQETETPSQEETPSSSAEAPSYAEASADTSADKPEEPSLPAETTETVVVEVDASTPTSIILPPEPEPVEEEPVVTPEETPEPEPSGIDTVSLENPQGNWLFKRIWWERAEERYEKIRLLVDAIWESRTQFFIKRNNLDRTVLDPFYINIGIDQGELQIILSEINEFLEKQREQQGDLTEQERMLYETYATDEEALKQLKLDVESISNLDHAIDDALIKLMDQINRVRQYEAQAWDNFKEIAHILNDIRARELYYMIEGSARNIKNISMYLEQEFFKHFDTLVNDATKHVTRVQNQIEALKEKGVNFQRQAELLEQKEPQENEDENDEDEDVKPKLGWFGWIGSLFSDTLSYIFSIIRLPYDMIFGK